MYLLIGAILFLSSCENNKYNNSQRTITVIGDNFMPIENVKVVVDKSEYFTDGKGQVKVLIQNFIGKINFELSKEGYTSVNIRVPNTFIGINDRYTLSKAPKIEQTITIIPEDKIPIVIAEESIPKPKKVVSVPKKVEKEETKAVVQKNYSEIFTEAEYYRENKDWENAIEKYNEIDKGDLDFFTKARLNSGIIKQTEEGNFKGAISDYTEVLETNNPKNFAEVYFNRGMCYHSLSKWNNAINDFKESGKYTNFFTGRPKEVKRKQHDLYFYLADALSRRATLENDKNRKIDYLDEAVLYIQDYLDRFENYNSNNTKQMKTYLKNFKEELRKTRS